MFHSRSSIACTAAILAAALMPIGGAVQTPSATELLADVQGCTRADASGTANVLAPPAAGFGVNWASPCVIIPNGGSVVWTQADGIPHGAVALDRCFDLGIMSAVGGTPAASAPRTTSLELSFLPEEGLVFTLGNGDELGLCALEAEGNALVLHYECIIHGARMPGKIVVEL